MPSRGSFLKDAHPLSPHGLDLRPRARSLPMPLSSLFTHEFSRTCLWRLDRMMRLSSLSGSRKQLPSPEARIFAAPKVVVTDREAKFKKAKQKRLI